MKHYSRILIGVAVFFIFFFPLFSAFFQFYCLWDADFLGSPQYEAPDILSMPSPSIGHHKFFVFSVDRVSFFIPNTNIFQQPFPIAFQLSYPEVTTQILRC